MEGTSLYRFCSSNGLKQWVTGPTHKDGHLLDLVISDPRLRSVEIQHAIADHNMVSACFDICIPESKLVIRKVLDYAMADWAIIKA